LFNELVPALDDTRSRVGQKITIYGCVYTWPVSAALPEVLLNGESPVRLTRRDNRYTLENFLRASILPGLAPSRRPGQ
jgi:hypothetical protein